MLASRMRGVLTNTAYMFRQPLLRTHPSPRARFNRRCLQQRNYNGYRYERFQSGKSFFVSWAQRPTFYRDIGLISAGAGGFYVYNLETVPVSGRRRFNVISRAQEESLDAESYKDVLQQFSDNVLPESDRRVRLVRKVAERLIPYSGLQDMKWEVFVIDSKETNAFVTPGGKIFVFTGILPICKNEDGIAAVLGHEIAHTVAHHAGERISRSLPLMAVPILLDLTLGIPGGISRPFFNLLFSLPNGRTQESEADYIGLLMMAQACYDPQEAAHLWARMQEFEKSHGDAPPEFISTHPSSHNRQDKIQSWMPEARDKQNASGCAPTGAYANQFYQVVDRWS